MATHIVTNVDGDLRRRIFVTGRTPKPDELKYVAQGLKLPPELKKFVPRWKEITGKCFSEWVQDEMRNTVYTETV